jgi:hypothetical protein
VRLGNIDNLDLNLFRFDLDLTFTVFFLDAEDRVYARYGQRDGRGPDELQSLKGLAHTMKSVLEMHAGTNKAFAPRDEPKSRTIREIAGRGRRCFHCHNVNEALDRRAKAAGKWGREAAFRYPLPDNLGLSLEVDRGNVVRRVEAASPGGKLGLKKGDLLRAVGGVPVHSIADAQFALERAPRKGEIEVKWERGGQPHSGKVALPEGWRRGDISWRTSLRRLVPHFPLRGDDLTEAEKKALGLPPKQLAFRQRPIVHSQAKAAGIQAGDVIVGVDGKRLVGVDAYGLEDYVCRHYLVGDRVQINLLRGGKRLNLPFTLR